MVKVMAKRCFGFYNEDGEREITMDLDKGQQELLSFLQDWGLPVGQHPDSGPG